MLLAVPGTGGAEEPPGAEECLACHSDPGLERSEPGPGRPAPVFVNPGAFQASVHGAFGCVACHEAATVPHAERLPAVQCTQCHEEAGLVLTGGAHAGLKPAPGTPAAQCVACHGSHSVGEVASLGVETCAACHPSEVGQYRASIHGRSRRREHNNEAATCTSCHGAAHAVLSKKEPGSPTYHLNLPRTCAQCHADAEFAKRHKIPVGDVYHLYMDSIHGRALTRSGLLVAANCSSCHGVHDITAAAEAGSRVSRTHIPGTCGSCHAGILSQYETSVHGSAVAAGNEAAPVCTSCHTTHEIRRVEREPWQLDVLRECGTCHEESLKTYRDTFHGKVTALGFARVAKCSNCHGAHAVFPASDARSMVSPSNLIGTCRQCHPGATAGFVQFQPHADYRDRERFPLLYFTYVFMTGLLVAVMAFFGVHTLLWVPRSMLERIQRNRRPAEGGSDP